jgi:DDE superfamily endonuclease
VAAARAGWRDEAAGLDPARLVSLDESGSDTRLVRTHARAPRGQRAHGEAPGGHWRRLTLIGALARGGIRAAMAGAAATGTAVFQAFVEQALIPAPLRGRPDAVVVMDNLGARGARTGRHRLPLPASVLHGLAIRAH